MIAQQIYFKSNQNLNPDMTAQLKTVEIMNIYYQRGYQSTFIVSLLHGYDLSLSIYSLNCTA